MRNLIWKNSFINISVPHILFKYGKSQIIHEIYFLNFIQIIYESEREWFYLENIFFVKRFILILFKNSLDLCAKQCICYIKELNKSETQFNFISFYKMYSFVILHFLKTCSFIDNSIKSPLPKKKSKDY